MILDSQLMLSLLSKIKSIDLSNIEYIVYYEKPLLTFERLLETYLATAPGVLDHL